MDKMLETEAAGVAAWNRRDDLETAVEEVRRQIGDLREDMGANRAAIDDMQRTLMRLEATIQAYQTENRAAHKAQDDRMMDLEIKRRTGLAAIAMFSSIFGGLLSRGIEWLSGAR